MEERRTKHQEHGAGTADVGVAQCKMVSGYKFNNWS